MNEFYAYIRVSTARQGERGVSLQEQRTAITRYAQRSNLHIRDWFQERETAAKQGRPVFGEMLKGLRDGTVRGVIIHKIDRSARNLKDWADLGELIDAGVEVHFANESMDLRSRGGRLSADIQAVVAADYIRNLREETKKGFYGRLKEGILPRPAPPGYRDAGGGKPKELDARTAPLVRRIFELYATGTANFHGLLEEASRIGLTGRSGKPLTLNGISKILNNPFYAGLIHIAKTGETFQGIHEPLIPQSVFDRVQDVIHGRLSKRTRKNDCLFRRRLVCQDCTKTLIGEPHKGFVYYRCHTRTCPTSMIREDAVETVILQRFQDLQLSDTEQTFLAQKLDDLRADEGRHQKETIAAIELQITQTDSRIQRLTDAYIDHMLDRESFEERKTALLSERGVLRESLAGWQSGLRNFADELQKDIELANSAYLIYKSGTVGEKRDVLDSITSNRLLSGKTLVITLQSPFDCIANRSKNEDGSPRRGVHRTWTTLLNDVILHHLKACADPNQVSWRQCP